MRRGLRERRSRHGRAPTAGPRTACCPARDGEARKQTLRALAPVRTSPRAGLLGRRSLHGGVPVVVGPGSRMRWLRVPGRGARAEMLWALGLVRLRMPAGMGWRSLHGVAPAVVGAG
ncbi:hypothetical protein GCM10010276_01390 [Streptomyces longisporus]|uniref:Uncharacterized protein n=1 Tax=Streptomyces longisporus TaxID=1948 RepID=A0ABN3KSY1_STRLO